MEENRLSLAPEKTEVIVLKGPRQRENININVQGAAILIPKAIKYPGIRIEAQGTFRHHIATTEEKADKRTAAISKHMPNIGGPKTAKKRLLAEVVNSIILYGASIWKGVPRIKRYKDVPISAQKTVLLRMACVYRTVATRVLQVMTATPPIDILVKERARIEDIPAIGRTR